MGKQLVLALCVVAMVAIIVGVDVLIFRYQFWPRLISNIGIVLIFAAIYFWVIR